MNKLINFAILLTSKIIKAMETAKEQLKEEAKKAQKPSASGNLRSLTKSVKNLNELKLVDEKDSKTLEDIMKRITMNWIENDMK